MTEIEEWRPVVGYEGLYEVSNLGRVKSLDRIDRLGRLKPGVILRPGMNGVGYLKVGLCKEGKVKTLLVHRLVAHAFIPNPEGLKEINHKDENKTNNRVDNLERCDHRYNCNYGTRNERQVQTRINNGTADPDMCGMGDDKAYHRLYYQKNQEKKLEYDREYRRRKKQRQTA